MVILEYFFKRLKALVICIIIAIIAVIVFGPIVFLIIKIKESNWYYNLKGKRNCKRGKHTYINGVCKHCSQKAPEHTHVWSKNGCRCTICDIKNHRFVKHKCEKCGAFDHRHDFYPLYGRCTICGELSPFHTHEFNNSCRCSTCGEYAHKYENGKCSFCGAIDPKHEHRPKKLYGLEVCICEICGKALHEYENGKCRICGEVDPKHEHRPKKLYGLKLCVCEICGKALHEYENGKCRICGKIDPDHQHTYQNEKCIICGHINPYHLHTYINDRCAICGALSPYHIHVLDAPDKCTGKCIICGKNVYKEHHYTAGICTVCGSIDPNHKHIGSETDKCVCKICGNTIHVYVKGTCVVCGERELGYTSKRRTCSGYPHNCSNCDYCRYE